MSTVKITSQEKELMLMICFDFTDEEICNGLRVTAKRLCEIKESCKTKLRAKTITQAVKTALNKGLLII